MAGGARDFDRPPYLFLRQAGKNQPGCAAFFDPIVVIQAIQVLS
jgi:hypothetical protein